MARRKKSMVDQDKVSDDGSSTTHATGDNNADGQRAKRAKRAKRTINYTVLPHHEIWIQQYFLTFISRISSRGSKSDNARTYVDGVLAPKFIAHFHKDNNMESEEMKDKFGDIAYAIYVKLNNLAKKERRSLKKADDPNCKVTPQFNWADANTEKIKAKIEKEVKAKPELAGSIGLWQTVVARLYEAVPPKEKSKWENQAIRDKAQKVAAAKAQEPLSMEEKMKYVREYCFKLEALIKEAERRAGIQTLVHYGATEMREGENGEKKSVMNVTSLMSSGSRGYNRTKDFVDGEERYGEYITEALGAPVEKKISIAITPTADGQPEIPDLPDNPVLSLLRTLVRVAVARHWMYAAGQGPVPWTEIAEAISDGDFVWVEKKRLPTELLPSGKRVRFIDPHEMTIDECLIWLRHLKRQQLGEKNTTVFFQFQQVYTTVDHKFPEWTKVQSKTPARRSHNQNVLRVRYEGYLDQPETYEPILYDQSSWDYFYRDTGKAGLFHWLGLPARPKAPIPPQISESELEVYSEWFNTIKDTQEKVYGKIFSTLELINRLDRGVPIIANNELWRLANGKARETPLALPQDPPSVQQLQEWLATPWIPSYFKAAHDVERVGTVTFFEDWQHRQRSGVLYHPHSKTFRAGRLGVVWIIRAVLKHMATVSGASGVLELPKAPPNNCELNRVTLPDWDRATQWLDSWHDLLVEACEVVELTAREQLRPALSPSSATETSKSAAGQTIESFDSDFDHTTVMPDDLNSALETRESRPRCAKANVLYVDPYAGVEELQEEREDSDREITEPESSDTDTNKAGSERRLPTMLKATPTRAVNFACRRVTFGPRPRVEEVVPYPIDLSKILEGVDRFFKSSTEVFATYKSMKFQYGLPYTTKLRTWIHEYMASLEGPHRHLVSTILLQRLTWRQAQFVWPYAEQQYRAFWECSRKGANLRKAIKSAKEAELAGPDMASILLQEDELRARVWTARLVAQQFAAFGKLSTSWANKLEDRFLTISLDADYDELKGLAAGIRDWRINFSTMVQDERAHRKLVDEKYQIDEYVPWVQDTWYWYGSLSGFVLSLHAEALVQDVPIETLIEESESDDEGGRGNEKSQPPQDILVAAEVTGKPASNQGSAPDPVPGDPDAEERPESTSGGNEAPADGALLTKPARRPKVKPVPPPSPTISSPPAHSTPPTTPKPSPHTLITEPATTISSSKTLAASQASQVTSASAKKPLSKVTSKMQPVIELSKKGSGNGKKTGAGNAGKTKQPAKATEETTPTSAPGTSSKKRVADSGSLGVRSKRKVGEEADEHEGIQQAGEAGEAEANLSTRPKRKRVLSAKARGML